MNGGRSRYGFTLVELLISIVVIAILASISVVAYNNIQERAYSARVIATIEAYAKTLKLYHIENGRFPPGALHANCLGRVSDYPAVDGFVEGACTASSNWSPDLASDDFADEMEEYMRGALPDPTIRRVREPYSDGRWTDYRGIYFEYQNNSPGSSIADWAYLEYVVKGKVPCPKDYMARYSENANVTFCNQIVWMSDGGID